MMILILLIILTFWMAAAECRRDNKSAAVHRAAITDDQDYDYAVSCFIQWQNERTSYRFQAATFQQQQALRDKIQEVQDGLNEWFRTKSKPESLRGINFNTMREGNFVVQGYNDPMNRKLIDERIEKIDKERRE